MSEQQQTTNNQQKQAKTKEEIEKEKANTSAWQKKQEEKKKKKLQEQQEQKPVEMDEKALQKAKRKEQKRLERQQMLKEQQMTKQQQLGEVKTQEKKNHEVKKSESKQVKPEGKKQQKKVEEKQMETTKQVIKNQGKKGGQCSSKQEVQISSRKLSKDKISAPVRMTPKPIYRQLLTLQKHLAKSFPSVMSINKPAQSRLIHKYLDQYINPNDTVLILSKTDSWHPLLQRCKKRVYFHPNHQEFTKQQSCQNITCTYEDAAYLMESTITKIFIEIDTVFANGYGLTQKGNENIISMANQYKIPVIGFTGTWNFNAWNFLSLNMFVNNYGENQLLNFDIIENSQLQIIVLEIGSVIPKQISGHLENLSKIYRGCDFNSIKW